MAEKKLLNMTDMAAMLGVNYWTFNNRVTKGKYPLAVEASYTKLFDPKEVKKAHKRNFPKEEIPTKQAG